MDEPFLKVQGKRVQGSVVVKPNKGLGKNPATGPSEFPVGDRATHLSHRLARRRDPKLGGGRRLHRSTGLADLVTDGLQLLACRKHATACGSMVAEALPHY